MRLVTLHVICSGKLAYVKIFIESFSLFFVQHYTMQESVGLCFLLITKYTRYAEIMSRGYLLCIREHNVMSS